MKPWPTLPSAKYHVGLVGPIPEAVGVDVGVGVGVVGVGVGVVGVGVHERTVRVRALITGGAGFIGSHLSEALLAR